LAQQQVEPPPTTLKPWYYQEWFLFPMFVFWPLWSVLILRSPWHNGILSGGIAWAMLFVWTYLIIWEQLLKTQRLNDLTLIIILPGLLFTVMTQIHWTMYKRTLADSARKADSASITRPKQGTPAGQHQPRPRPSRRRRPRR